MRYDGGHKADRFLLDILAAHVEFVPVCPELEVGMGLPRESVHLLSSKDGVNAGGERVRLVGVRSGEDWTERMTAWSSRKMTDLQDAGLCGFVLKKDSPSCGLMRVRVHHPTRAVARTGRGLFAETLSSTFSTLPLEEEGRLHDARLRENFIERVFAFRRVRAFFGKSWTVGALVAFHTGHKLQLLAHSRVGYDALGRLVADAKKLPRAQLAIRYQTTFMAALSKIATPGRNADVMLHMLGHFKHSLAPGDRQELLQLISDYRAAIVPLIVPLTLFRHHVRVHGVDYLEGQTYLEPSPRELALRNHA